MPVTLRGATLLRVLQRLGSSAGRLLTASTPSFVIMWQNARSPAASCRHRHVRDIAAADVGRHGTLTSDVCR